MIIDEAKGKFIVNMNGKEYLHYRQYTDNKSKNFTKNLKNIVDISKYFVLAFIIYILGKWLISTIFPTQYVAKNYGMFSIYGFVFPYLLLYIVIVMIAFAWLLHGFGFIIIKR